MFALKESQQEVAALLRSISNRYPKDSEIQRMVALAALELADQVSKSTELLGYRDPEAPAGDNGHE